MWFLRARRFVPRLHLLLDALPKRVSVPAARASSYWFGNRGVVYACWNGLVAAALPPERKNELEREFRKAYARRFQEELPAEIEDPDHAIPWESRYDDDDNISEAFDDLSRSDPPANYWRSVIAKYLHRDLSDRDNESWGVTTFWAKVDFIAMVKQYGMPWCLRSGEYKESQIARMFSNREATKNESALRNTLSTLRV
jgi:hypothetical protein